MASFSSQRMASLLLLLLLSILTTVQAGGIQWAAYPPDYTCTQGHIHQGNATGSFIKIGNVDVYVSRPPPPPRHAKLPKPSNKTAPAILFLTDVMGIQSPNAQLLADTFAQRANTTVFMPDYFFGDPIPMNRPPSFNMTEWSARHGTNVTDPIIEQTIAYIRGPAVNSSRVNAVGYCFGGKYVARFLAPGKGLHVGYTAHPSNLAMDEVKAIKRPLAIAAAAEDTIFTPQLRASTEGTLRNLTDTNLKKLQWTISVYSGVAHGFGLRADMNDTNAVWAMQQAFKVATDWFARYL